MVAGLRLWSAISFVVSVFALALAMLSFLLAAVVIGAVLGWSLS